MSDDVLWDAAIEHRNTLDMEAGRGAVIEPQAITGDALVLRIMGLLEAHLQAQEDSRRALSLLAAGAAFESWLSFETRLLIEHHRAALGLDEQIDLRGAVVPRFWAANEYNKVDLGVLDLGSGSNDDIWELALEFKLITNNKNWPAKCYEVRNDLLPAKGAKKHEIYPIRGRYAVVALIGKVYREPGPYGWESDLETWNGQVCHAMSSISRVTEIWCGRRFTISDAWLVQDAPHFCELHVLRRADRQ